MQHILLDIDIRKIHVDPEAVLHLLGSRDDDTRSHTLNLVDCCIKKALELATPRGAFAIWQTNDLSGPDEIATEALRFHTGKIVRRMLKGAHSFAFFIATVGNGPENLSRKLMEEGNYLEGYATDLIASVMVDAIADQIHKQVRNEAASLGMKVTNRYSPGYCSWDVSDQQKLFSLFPGNRCGITLSESSLMSPIKSVSGVIGIGKSVRYQEYTCDNCSMKGCQFRKTGS